MSRPVHGAKMYCPNDCRLKYAISPPDVSLLFRMASAIFWVSSSENDLGPRWRSTHGSSVEPAPGFHEWTTFAIADSSIGPTLSISAIFQDGDSKSDVFYYAVFRFGFHCYPTDCHWDRLTGLNRNRYAPWRLHASLLNSYSHSGTHIRPTCVLNHNWKRYQLLVFSAVSLFLVCWNAV